MYPTTGSIVIIKRLKLDAVGDDQDPAIVNSVRAADPFRRPGYVVPEGPSNDPSRVGPVLSEAERTGTGPLPTELPAHASLPGNPQVLEPVAFSNENVVPAPVPSTDLSERRREINRRDELDADGLPALKEGESRPAVPGPIVLTPPDAFINATMFPEGALPRTVRNVPFFASKEVALKFRGNEPPRAPASDPDKYLVAYWPDVDSSDERNYGQSRGVYDGAKYADAPYHEKP